MSPRIYYLKARNQKVFATHTPLRCRPAPALEPVDMFAPPAPSFPCDGGGLLVLVYIVLILRFYYSEKQWDTEVCSHRDTSSFLQILYNVQCRLCFP